jgi:hypothetical protein
MTLFTVDWCDLLTTSLKDITKYFLVLGTPRSGLAYTTLVLRQLKLSVVHEGIGGDGACGWPFVPCVVDNPAINKLYTRVTILHQVRNPLHSISSMQCLSEEAWSYIAHYLKMDLMKTNDLVFRGMQCWYHWNKMVEDKAIFTYRVEAMERVWGNICELLRINRIVSFPLDISTNINTKAEWYESLEEEDLLNSNSTLASRILSLGRRYGYKEF